MENIKFQMIALGYFLEKNESKYQKEMGTSLL